MERAIPEMRARWADSAVRQDHGGAEWLGYCSCYVQVIPSRWLDYNGASTEWSAAPGDACSGCLLGVYTGGKTKVLLSRLVNDEDPECEGI